MLRPAVATVFVTLGLLATRPAWALAPSDVWTAANSSGATFSADGSSVLTAIANGFQMRNAATGALEKTITLPAASRAYDAHAFSPDKQYVAVTYRASGVTRIELYSVAKGTLVRTINSPAVRNSRGIDLSSNGLIALFERFGYGGGGNVYAFQASTGALVDTQGPYTRNSTTDLRFSPDGTHLAISERQVGELGVRVVSTSNWETEEFIPDPAFVFSWSRDNAALWISGGATADNLIQYNLVAVPSGAVISSTAVDTNRYFPNSVTPDNRFLLATTVAEDGIAFLRASDGRAEVSYTVKTRAGLGGVSPTGTLFAYSVCPENASSCVLHVARMPSL